MIVGNTCADCFASCRGITKQSRPDHKGFMIVDRQACLYEHKEKTFELSALRAAGDYEEIIVRGVAEIRNPDLTKSGLRSNPDRITKKSRPNKRI